MHNDLLPFLLTAFIMLSVVINPIAVAPIFLSVTQGRSKLQRRSILTRAVSVALCVTLFFLLAGRALLSYLGVTMHAFAVSGGILLFLIALPMLFGQRVHPRDDHAVAGDDGAIFPLAIPMLAGPGTLATVLVLATQADGNWPRIAALAGILATVYGLSWAVLDVSDRLIERLGENKMNVITRVLGIILAALAVQYVFNGITGYYQSL